MSTAGWAQPTPAAQPEPEAIEQEPEAELEDELEPEPELEDELEPEPEPAGIQPPPPVPPAPSLAIHQTSVPGADTGAAYSTRLTASGGGSQSWSVVGGVLPVGIQLAADGTLSGRATIAGDYTFTVRVQAGGGTAQRTFTIAVREGVTASIQATKQAEQGVALTLRPAFAGGLAPHAWSLASGSLPACTPRILA